MDSWISNVGIQGEEIEKEYDTSVTKVSMKVSFISLKHKVLTTFGSITVSYYW